MSIFRAARFLFGLGLQVDAVRLLRATVLAITLFVAAPLAALALRDLTENLLAHRPGPALTSAVLASTALVAQLMLGHFCHLDLTRVADAQEMRLRGELMDLVNGSPRIDHLDRPEVADDVELVRDGLIATSRSLEGVLQLAGLLVQMTVTIVLLVMVSPLFAVLPLCALVPVLLERTAQSRVEGARERTAERFRLAKHLLELVTSAGPVRELRLSGAGDEIVRRHRDAWGTVTTAMWRAQLEAASYRALGQGCFALGYGGAVALELHRHAPVGDLVLVITLAVQVSMQVAGLLGVLSLLQVAGRTTDRIGDLRAAAPPAPAPTADPPGRPASGITLEDVSFRYPGAERPVLSGVSMHIPAGSVLALVGENGAGKSTLVKLLCGLYAPTGGRILVDGQDLAALGPARWRSRVAALFQDFQHIELTLGESIGHGDIARIGDTGAIQAAADRAGVPGGLGGYVGHAYADGTELSGGQWQKVGLARTLMRRHPRLLILDEPAAALDAAAEHELFERYARSAGRADGITLLISHRFSTVRMAGLIAVLDQGRLTECGTHQELMAREGLYAELFGLQARAYE